MLLIDIGNTDIVVAYYVDDVIKHSFRIPSLAKEDHLFFHYRIASELFERGIRKEEIHLVVVSSVVPTLTPVIQRSFKEYRNLQFIQIEAGSHPAVSVNTDRKNELGTDIYCNAVAAFLEFQTACIVVDFGTALTVTGIDSNGKIQGVAIAPGLKTALKSLFRNTAQLPEVSLEVPISALGKNTTTAIQSGILYGYEGLVKNLVEKFRNELGSESKVYITGGLSSIIPGLSAIDAKTDINLTLRGIYAIGKLYL
jgi:type III pantothenate kinase